MSALDKITVRVYIILTTGIKKDSEMFTLRKTIGASLTQLQILRVARSRSYPGSDYDTGP